jgi:hypothetical protein
VFTSHGDSELCLQATREAHEVRTETEASTLASSHTDRRRHEVEHGEDGRGDEGKRGDLIERERLAGDEDSSTSHHEALDQILDSAIDNFGDVHWILYSVLRKISEEDSMRSIHLKSSPRYPVECLPKIRSLF